MSLVPDFVRRSPFYFKYGPSALRSRILGNRNVFSEIYSKNLWGGKAGEFFSGTGSRGEVADAYVDLIKDFVRDKGVRSVVDLGCGDMFIGKQIMGVSESYMGVDIVEPLIEAHRQTLGSDKAQFRCLDITAEPLPSGDLCLVRQVFQHLSNAQIKTALGEMLASFSYVVVSEHFPPPHRLKKLNLDKAPGTSTRAAFGSAVVLSEPPYGLNCTELLSVYVPESAATGDDYYIKTFLINR